MKKFNSLQEWLTWQKTLHPVEIELGLTRCRAVAQRVGLLDPSFTIISIAGTNGKGSSAALLDAIYSAAGYRTGRYTSPELLRYNERICIGGQEIGDAELCDAFARIDDARGDISLTYFEFGTLAAMCLFEKAAPDIVILETGLGGRLDAVNLLDADVALITALGIDHTEWLGEDRDSISLEKAGIFRANHAAVCADPDPPKVFIARAKALQTHLYQRGKDFDYEQGSNTWSWHFRTRTLYNLALPALNGAHQLDNAAGVLMAAEHLSARFPVPDAALNRGLAAVRLPGRMQRLPERISCIADVAHNPLGARALKQALLQDPCEGRSHALIGILQDKNIPGIIEEIREVIDIWHVAGMNTPRGASAEILSAILMRMDIRTVHTYSSIRIAYKHLLAMLPPGDRLIVFGSFYAVAEVLALF
ncbi:MAG: bifunctional tetrahydrofolate synthase/dihydrofolate synthase [Gammaproteobacteria bacterium]|nr:bifunctional tetrahydrofolate synthase/dihydrofolate synthase [Gammaproteobacteria bacterium]